MTAFDGSQLRTERRRILVLSPRDPYPVIVGDRLRIHRLARELARHHDLTLLTLCPSTRERDAPMPTDGVFKQVHRVVLPEWRSWLNALAAVPSSEPLQVAYYRSSRFRAAVRELAGSHDAVLAHLIRTADYVRDVPTLKILEMTDAISMGMQRVRTSPMSYFDPRRIIYGIEARRLRKHERRVAEGFDLVTLTSAVDKNFVFGTESRPDLPVMVVPNGVDAPEALPPAQAARNRDEIAFIGNVGTLQNFDAAWFFAVAVFPLIRAKRPNAVFRIIGPIRRKAARQLAALPGVVVEGPVASLTHALATARVGVCPNRMSAGIQNKVLEYFANRLAVVCSSLSLGGIEAQADEHLLRADPPEEWAAQVERLLADEALAQRVADAGRELACRAYRWSQRTQPLISRVANLFEQRARLVPSAVMEPDEPPVLAESGL